ncbi:type II secretion system F family protein [Clostridium magnum]|uniref:Type II secretion system protein F n=1 Tax=Clostridium magnum DSM 2767 TaxID=1121326 RepID=A0A162U3D9_9CLOT|nr:type II secretion system F family protein [Clostridium magnum]KZL93385.1 type II secretion system protein F [Clostridium magnum DSM 2767]SHI16022.1 type IV pilus assembly protein PilC [Clostridium magnum DSM 2767]
MKKFIYKAWDQQFNIVKGIEEGADIERVIENIKMRDLKIIYVKEKNTLLKLALLKRTLNDEALANFCGQIAMIINSGVNILNGLEIMEQQAKNNNMKKILSSLIESIKGGNSLSAAIQQTGSFPTLLIDMLITGEVSGNLDTILFNMEGFYIMEANIKSKIKSASIYPLLILIVSIGMVVFFDFFIFPDLKDMFTDVRLPLITTWLLQIMNYINSNYLFIIIFVVLIVILIKYAITIPQVKYIIDKAKLNIPSIGLLNKNIITSRFTRSMGIFLKSAVSIVTIMDNMKAVISNEFISTKIENAKIKLEGGMNFSEAIEDENVFDPLVIQMMKVGEETGRLDDMMLKLADKYDERVDLQITRIMALIEPVLTLVIGSIVGIVIVAMALPIMQMTQNMK